MVVLLYEPIKVPVWSPRRKEATNPVEILVEEKKRNWLRSWAKKQIEVESSTVLHVFVCGLVVRIFLGVLHVFDCGLAVRIF
ncbi:hypothetical protein HID58_081520 [Brassica napus]|uniref:Transmembrane protein n=1 Tax=Brassica napus TaxID=3708 RepID=A0ABQ7Y7Y6_BRANA|nr:hypothetical protein HID58_081520 [Brassica napus]